MNRASPTAWKRFRDDPRPLVTIRELKAAMPDGPGLPAMYKEAKERRTVLGVQVLTCQGRNYYLSRQAIVNVVEGREGEA